MRAILAGLSLAFLAGCGTAPHSVATPTLPAGAYDAFDAPDPVGPLPARFSEIVNTHQDLLFRGGVPNDDHLKLLLETGLASKQSPGAPVKIRTIVNLLDPAVDAASIAHERAAAEAAGASFVNIPLPWGKGAPRSMTTTWFKAVSAARKDHTGLYVHCTHGRDRTGSMVAVYREQFDGWTPKAALAEMEGAPFGFDAQRFPWMADFVTGFKPGK